MLLFQRSVWEAENRVRGDVLCDLLEGRADDSQVVVQRVQALGVDLQRSYGVLVASTDDHHRRDLVRARRCLEAMRAVGREGDAACLDDLGFIGLLLSEKRDIAQFVELTLGPVLSYDEERGTALRHTLDEYFAHGSNLAATADALHVHVNTVTQRLDRVGRLLGSDWKSPERALQLHLALQLRRLRTPTLSEHPH